VGRYLVELATATREHPSVLVGASPRGSLALMLMARGVAAMAGRDFVVPEDVKRVAVAALAHRVTLRPEMWLRRIDASQIVTAVLGSVPTPVTAALPAYGGA
jgi:MoxR-like ATPase